MLKTEGEEKALGEKLYAKVYNDVIARIKNGELKVGDKLPSEIELAKRYGVSRITVTRAMKELSDINLVYRVKKGGTFVNGKLNFRTTQLIIPVILPFGEEFNATVKGIQSITTANNIFTPVYNTRNNIMREEKYLRELLGGKFDGLIVYPCNSRKNLSLYAEILAAGKPIVCIDRNICGIDTPLVTSRNAKGMEQIVDKLVSLGHKKIAFFSLSDSMAPTESERFKGFCSGLIKNKLELRTEYLFNSENIHLLEMVQSPTKQHSIFHRFIHKCLDEYFAFDEKPSAICCINDVSANGLYLDAVERGIRIPEDLMITGFDSIDTQTNAERHIISVSQNFFEIGASAIKLMLAILNGQSYQKEQKIDVLMNADFPTAH